MVKVLALPSPIPFTGGQWGQPIISPRQTFWEGLELEGKKAYTEESSTGGDAGPIQLAEASLPKSIPSLLG